MGHFHRATPRHADRRVIPHRRRSQGRSLCWAACPAAGAPTNNGKSHGLPPWFFCCCCLQFFEGKLTGKHTPVFFFAILGVDGPFFSAIVLFKNRIHFFAFFFWVCSGFLERRIPEKNGEVTARAMFFAVCFFSAMEPSKPIWFGLEGVGRRKWEGGNRLGFLLVNPQKGISKTRHAVTHNAGTPKHLCFL